MTVLRNQDPFYYVRTYEPYNKLQREVNRLFDSFFTTKGTPVARGVFPPVNLSYDDDNLYLTAELPGFETGDLNIQVEPESVQIKGERKIETEGDDCHYHRRERKSGKFTRAFSLPTSINTNNVSAKMNDGILSIIMPKAEEQKPKKIEITAS